MSFLQMERRIKTTNKLIKKTSKSFMTASVAILPKKSAKEPSH